MVIKPTDFFECNSLPLIVDSAKLSGLFSFFEKLFPVLLENRFEISDFLCALECYLRNQGFADEVCGKLQQACAEIVKTEQQRKESEN